jgi:uncharacterized LabA/DUF88 family protein
MVTDVGHAALFVDYENIYYFVKNGVTDDRDAGDIAVSTIRKLQTMLLHERQMQCIVQHAYADFERIGGGAQGAFYLMGLETHNVLGSDHKNAADMRLCIDAMDTLYTRPEINAFVFVAGDRDYIPVVQHLKKHAKTVLVVSFKGNASGDLLQVADEKNFIDAASILPDGVELAEQRKETEDRLMSPSLRPSVTLPPLRARPPVTSFAPEESLSEDERDALRLMLTYFADKSEIWMTPYLHRQRAQMPHLAEYERRDLINGLREKGAITIEKRTGDDVEYSVMIVNWNHPEVRALAPGR